MLDPLRFEELGTELASMGLQHWPEALRPLCEIRLSAHGDSEHWQHTLRQLPGAAKDPGTLKNHLLELSPWRKGPFSIAGVDIDSEWRSDLKWARLADAIAALDGRRVLDVGCGNGYYALEMRKSGAELVLGIDPTVLYVMQFIAVNSFVRDPGAYVLPLRLEELPRDGNAFDTAFSMGVFCQAEREPPSEPPPDAPSSAAPMLTSVASPSTLVAATILEVEVSMTRMSMAMCALL